MKENKETLFWHFKDQALGERGGRLRVWRRGGGGQGEGTSTLVPSVIRTSRPRWIWKNTWNISMWLPLAHSETRYLTAKSSSRAISQTPMIPGQAARCSLCGNKFSQKNNLIGPWSGVPWEMGWSSLRDEPKMLRLRGQPRPPFQEAAWDIKDEWWFEEAYKASQEETDLDRSWSKRLAKLQLSSLWQGIWQLEYPFEPYEACSHRLDGEGGENTGGARALNHRDERKFLSLTIAV